MTLLRAELLAGHAVALAGPVEEGLASALKELGAQVQVMDEDRTAQDADLGRWAREHGPLRALVYDARPSFGPGGPDSLNRCVHRAWLAIREVAVGALIEASEPGKVVLIGPDPDAGRHAEAAAAALENLVRTLSIEWARYGVTAVMVAPASGTDEAELAELVAFLCSAAGDYVSGCRLELGSPQ
jgi:NAD(P)-dependent dehydrogenase (short-subunit alcohol dehydrogenase family)